jgi:hypothetical protein
MQAKLVADVTVKVELTGIMPLSFGKHHDEPHVSNEKESAYEVRTYREKLHFNDQGEIFVPAMMAKKSLDAAVKHKGDKIAGRGKATYTKYFETGCRVLEDFPLTFNGSPITKDSVPYEKLFVPSDGVAGSGKRVNKWFPKIDIGWQCTGEFLILNNIIDPETFVRMLKYAGTFIGLGRWRIQNAGNYGMFVPTSIIWNGKVLI